MSGRVFFFHYNKPASRAAGEARLSVHQSGRCHIVQAIDCRVPVQSRNRRTQPRCVLAGRGSVTVVDGTALITLPEGAR